MSVRGTCVKFKPTAQCAGGGKCDCDRPRWRVRAFAFRDPIDGRQHRPSKVIEAPHNRNGERAALDEMAKLVDQANQERRDLQAAPDRMTIGEALDRWIEHKSPRWAGNTLRSAEFGASKIRPALGGKVVSTLTHQDIDRFYGQLERNKLGNESIRKVHAALTGCLTLAVRWGAITASPISAVTPPQVISDDWELPEPEHLAEKIFQLLEKEHEMGAWILLAAGTGMRPGEQCALQWVNVDLEGQSIHVRHAVRKGNPDEENWVLATTKTKKGRQVAIGGGLTDALRALRANRVESAEALGLELDHQAFVFSLDPRGRSFTNPELWDHRWGAARKTIEVDGEVVPVALRDRYDLGGIKLYAMRHFAATQMIAAGHDIAAVAEQLGHSPEVLMRIYAHPIDQNRRAAADSLDSKLRRPTKKRARRVAKKA